jgi:hypothetical protein
MKGIWDEKAAQAKQSVPTEEYLPNQEEVFAMIRRAASIAIMSSQQTNAKSVSGVGMDIEGDCDPSQFGGNLSNSFEDLASILKEVNQRGLSNNSFENQRSTDENFT